MVGYAIWYGEHGPAIHPAWDGCRDYDCCGGERCGYDLEGVKRELIAHYETVEYEGQDSQRRIDEIRHLTPKTALWWLLEDDETESV